MVYDEKKARLESAHHFILEGREKLSVTGVEEVESFDDTIIVMDTTKGVLVARGQDLHITRLSLDVGELCVEGMIESLTYEQAASERKSLFSRLFR
jgi:sporulation protein YabP